MDNFELTENLGRNKAMKAMSNVSFSNEEYTIVPTDHYCTWDFDVISKKTNKRIAIVEAKDRRMPSYDRRVSEGVILEAYKYDKLKEKSVEWNIPSYYLATMEDDAYFLWNIAESEVRDDWRMCNKTTAVESEKIMKHCYYFDADKATFKGKF